VEIDLTGLVLPERIEVVQVSDDGRSAQFVIEPLERGFGHTLGNSVRRVLLSSLRGAAVWAFRIEGVVHEHQTIPGVVEDVHQVIQNLKSLVLTLDDDVDEAVLTLRTRKAGSVTASEINAPSGVAVLDPEHHLFTLQEDRDLNLELHVNKGRGFVLADGHTVPKGSPVDLVRIDSIYNPVRRANFTVEETRVGQRTDFDKLTLQIETDGSVSPDSAVQYGAELVRKHLEYMFQFGAGGAVRRAVRTGLAPLSDRLQELLSRDLEELTEMTVRSRNSLQKENILTLRQLVEKTEQEMMEINNFGRKSLKEIADFLQELGLRFGMRIEEGQDGRLFVHHELPEPAEAGEL